MVIHRKRVLLETAESLKLAIEEINNSILKESFPEVNIFADCQTLAAALGDALEERKENTEDIIHLLEDYCELIYQLSQSEGNPDQIKEYIRILQKVCFDVSSQIMTVIENDKKEIVFLPYKAAMWDSLESLWMRARDDETVNAVVIPIPYYDKNPDGSFKEIHYEIDRYPEYVPVVDYRCYDLESNHPDVIYIHNPYDGHNIVTSVHPDYYSSKIKNYTDCLIYVPYFVLAEIDPEDKASVAGMSHFCTVSAVFHAHKVIVQSEAMRTIYINVLSELAGEETRKVWEAKIDGSGSPKFDKILNTSREDTTVPDEWKRIIEKPDGNLKKIIFYNTSVASLLKYGEQMLEKIRDVLRIFYDNRDKVVLLWRPHPMMKATIESMRPELWADYSRLVEQYRASAWGIYDDTSDLNRAIAISDGYYGDESSVVHLCKVAGLPVMIQNPCITGL